MDIYLNGKMIAHDKAQISVHDAGFQHAVGLFETMACVHGQVFRLDAHLRRLQQSAAILGLGEVDLNELKQAVQTTITENILTEARVRLTVTPGPVSLLRSKKSDTPPPKTVMVVPSDPVQYDPGYFDDGITALIGPQIANPFDPTAGHKTLAYWSRLRVLRQAASAGVGETIVLNVTNHIASGAVSNVFIVSKGKLITPIARGEEKQGALPAPVLPGITRATVMELAAKNDIDVERRMIAVDELLDADEAFLTNSSWQVLPVTNIEKKTIADGKVGTVTQQLRADLLQLIETETG